MTAMRSLLFAPANRDKFVLNFATLRADGYCIDLEDGTAAADKEGARAGLPALVARLRAAPLSGPLFVRVNDPASALGKADVAACRALALDGIMIPKVSSAEDLRRIDGSIAPDRSLVVLIETVAGVANARAIARAARPGSWLAFGAEDFVTDIGGRRTPDGLEVLHARSELLLAARLAGLGALDQVVVEVRDDARFEADAAAARALGYDGKLCLTPRQVELANATFSPSAEEVATAGRLVAAFEEAERRAQGAIDFEGRMVDAPLVARARRILALRRD
jgi:citrate lyase subunit beta/citryl-CoA lyase